MAFKVADHPPKNGRGLLQLGAHLTVLVLTSFVVSVASAWWLVPAVILHGLILVALFAPNHECVHRTVFATPWLNDWTAAILGWLLFIPSIDFRYFHFAHHRHTQDPERDPELASAKPTTLMGYLFALTGIPLYRSTWAWFWALAVSSEHGAYLPANKRAAATRQARIYIFMYAVVIVVSVWLQTWVALLYWVGPFVLAQPFLRAYLMAEHTGCDHSRDMFANTRTVLSNRLVRWLMWNMPFHAEHHAHPSVPFYALPLLHKASQGKHRVIEPGYRRTHQRIRAQY